MGKTRRYHAARVKLEAAIAMISGKSPVAELSQKYGVHPSVLQRWKTELLEGGAEIFNRANQVWATDITYIKIPSGMAYLFALID